MNVFRVWRGYRKFGLNYGLPVFHVDCGVGVGYDPIDLVKKLVSLELGRDSWVVIRNGLNERGVGTFIEGLKYIGAKVEVEGEGIDVTPGWFPLVDRWIVEYRENGPFNYGALRPRQDMLVFRDSDVEGFLGKTKDLQALRAIVTDDGDGVWDKVKNCNVRIYSRAD